MYRVSQKPQQCLIDRKYYAIAKISCLFLTLRLSVLPRLRYCEDRRGNDLVVAPWPAWYLPSLCQGLLISPRFPTSDDLLGWACPCWTNSLGQNRLPNCWNKKCLKVRQKLGTRKFFILKFKFQIQKLKWLKLILGKCWTTFVFMSRLKSRCLKLKMSMVFFWHQWVFFW